MTVMMAVLEAERARARLQHADLPEYMRTFDNVGLVRVLRRVTCKNGVAFEQHQFALRKPGYWFATGGAHCGWMCGTLYSPAVGAWVGVAADAFKEVELCI